MGDHDGHALVFLQVVFQPLHAFGVEMVGRLIQQQNIGLFEEQLAQRNAALFPARQLVDGGLARRATQRVHGNFKLIVERPAIDCVNLLLKSAHFLHQLVEVGIVLGVRHLGGDRVEAVHHRRNRAHAIHDVAAHILGRVELRLLRQIADGDAFAGPGLADELLVDTGDDLHQRRLAGAVRPDDGDLGARQKAESNILERRLGGAGVGLRQTLHHIGVLIGHGFGLSDSRLKGCERFSGCRAGVQMAPAADAGEVRSGRDRW